MCITTYAKAQTKREIRITRAKVMSSRSTLGSYTTFPIWRNCRTTPTLVSTRTHVAASSPHRRASRETLVVKNVGAAKSVKGGWVIYLGRRIKLHWTQVSFGPMFSKSRYFRFGEKGRQVLGDEIIFSRVFQCIKSHGACRFVFPKLKEFLLHLRERGKWTNAKERT